MREEQIFKGIEKYIGLSTQASFGLPLASRAAERPFHISPDGGGGDDSPARVQLDATNTHSQTVGAANSKGATATDGDELCSVRPN